MIRLRQPGTCLCLRVGFMRLMAPVAVVAPPSTISCTREELLRPINCRREPKSLSSIEVSETRPSSLVFIIVLLSSVVSEWWYERDFVNAKRWRTAARAARVALACEDHNVLSKFFPFIGALTSASDEETISEATNQAAHARAESQLSHIIIPPPPQCKQIIDLSSQGTNADAATSRQLPGL